jgi:SPP1 family holin
MDKGSIIRTIVLFVALANQFLVMNGMSPLPIADEQIEMVGSTLFTIVASLITWYKNNYITKKGQAQKIVLKRNNLN